MDSGAAGVDHVKEGHDVYLQLSVIMLPHALRESCATRDVRFVPIADIAR